MNSELEIEDGGEMGDKKGISRTSRYQVLTAERRNLCRKERLWGYLERSEMKNPVYYRLFKNDCFAGFKREVTEYLSPGSTRWQLDPVPHDSEETQKLSRPAMGTATLGRQKIATTEQMRVTNPKSKDQSCTGLPASGDCPPMPRVKSPKNEDE